MGQLLCLLAKLAASSSGETSPVNNVHIASVFKVKKEPEGKMQLVPDKLRLPWLRPRVRLWGSKV